MIANSSCMLMTVPSCSLIKIQMLFQISWGKSWSHVRLGWWILIKLSLHLGKTECMLFDPRRKLRKITTCNFQELCNGHVIKATEKVKYLGLSIDSLLNGESILLVSSIIQKVNTRIKFLYRQAGCLDRGSRMTLSSALIQCYFDYSCSSWYSSLNKQLKLPVCQNKMVRFILYLGHRHSINCDILDSLNMLNVEARVKQLRLNHVFNIVQGLAPNYLQENFTLVSSTRDLTG